MPDDAAAAQFFADSAKKAPLGGLGMTLEQVAILSLLDRIQVLDAEVRSLRAALDALTKQAETVT